MVRLAAGSDGLSGRMIVGSRESQLESVAVAGDALYFRLAAPIVYTATVVGDTMRGRAESQYGDTYRS